MVLPNRIMITESKTTDSKVVLEVGSLQSMFPCSSSKIMDFMITFHKYDYSISDIGKHSGITFKTALNEVKKLEEQGVLIRTRNVGKAIMFQFNSESIQAKSLRKLCLDIAKSRIN